MPLSPTAENLRKRALALAERGAWTELPALLAEDAVAVRDQPELVSLRAEALLRIGRARDARGWLDRSMSRLVLSRDRAVIRRAHNILGAASFELGDLEPAEQAFATALELARQDGDDLLLARANNNLGAIANIRGNREAALALYHLAIPAHQRLGNPLGLAECYHNMAISYRDLGDLERAQECEAKSLEFARDSGNARQIALTLLGRAELTLRAGDAALAEVAALRVAEAFGALPDPIRQSDALRLAGVSAFRLGRVDNARSALDSSITLARQHGGALNEAEALCARAELEEATGDPGSALADARAAAAIFRRLAAGQELDALAGLLQRLSAATGEQAASEPDEA